MAQETQSPVRTAVLCIIGDEILNGRVQDSNGYYIAQRLAEIGVRVWRIVILPDEIQTIAHCIRHWAARCDYLFTSGGIGPTHDDITRAAVARAMGRELEMNPEARRILEAYYGDRLTEARLAMAMQPAGAELIPNPISGAPGCIVGNVFVLPGIPEVLHIMFESVVDRLDSVPHLRFEIRTSAYEGDFATWLGELCRRFPQVHVGSYPRLGDPRVRSVITITSHDFTAAQEVHELILAALPAE